jgi:hypothetical protein
MWQGLHACSCDWRFVVYQNPMTGTHKHRGKTIEEDVVDLSAFAGRKAHPGSTFTGNTEIDFSLTGFKHRGSAVYGIVVKPVGEPVGDAGRDRERRASRVEACTRSSITRQNQSTDGQEKEEIMSFR